MNLRTFLFFPKGGAVLRKLLLILLCMTLLLGNVFAASDEITNMDVQVTVDANGTSTVVVLVDVRFVSQPTTLSFPLSKDAKDITASGASYKSKTIDGVKYVIFENESGFSGTQTFQCSFSLPCTMSESATKQHYTAMIPERGWDYPINRFKLTVTFPTEVTDFPHWQSAYYGDVIDNYLTVQIRDNIVTAKSNIAFRDHETLRMDLDFRPDAFVLKHLAERSVSFDRMSFLALIGVCIIYWLVALIKARIKVQKGTFHFQYSAGEIPCLLSGDSADIGALLAHWGNLGYVVLHRTRNGRFRLERQMPMGNERSTAERRIFHSLFRRFHSIEIGSPRFFAAVNSELPVLRAQWRNRIFQKQDGRPGIFLGLCLVAGLFFSLMLFDSLLSSVPGRWVWIILLTLLSLGLYRFLQQVVPHWYCHDRWFYIGGGAAGIAIMYLFAIPAELGSYLFFNLLLQIWAGYVTRFGGHRTVPGTEIIMELLGFRHSVVRCNRESARKELQRNNQYFYLALPYAEIMGISKRFRKYFGAATTETCPWVVDDQSRSSSAESFYRFYKDLLQQIRTEQRSTLIRNIAGAIEVSLPRIRPTSPGGNGRSGRSTSSHSRSTGRPSSHRSSSGHRSDSYRPNSHDYSTRSTSDPRRTGDPRRASSVSHGHEPRRTQHRANPAYTGRRS